MSKCMRQGNRYNRHDYEKGVCKGCGKPEPQWRKNRAAKRA